MVNPYYRIEIAKPNSWVAILYKHENKDGLKLCDMIGTVISESYSELQIEMANRGFIDKVNNIN